MKSNYLSTNSLKRKKMFFCLSAGFLLGTCLVSCELEDFEEPLEETYTKSFIKNFGLIDQNQDWNMATRAEVSVTTDEPSHIKVYGRVDGEYRLMGDFLDVTGSQKLQFDTPRGVTDLLVSDGSTSLSTTVGQSVNFASMQTRTAHTTDETGSNNPLGVKVAYLPTGDEHEYEYFTENSDVDNTGVYYYRNKLPEKVFNANASGVDTDFKFSSGDKDYSFIIYPVYWNTSNTITIGIQYTYGGNDYKVPVYTMKSGDELQAKVESVKEYYKSVKPSDYTDWPSDLGSKNPSEYSDEEKQTAINFIKEKLGYTKLTDLNWYDSNITFKSYTEDWKSLAGYAETIDKDATQYRSKGIKVTIPANTDFIVYCTYTNGQYTSYSLTEKNEKVTYNGETVYVPHIATFLNNNNERCIGFEDFYNMYTGTVAEGSEGEPDLNDLIIYTTLATPENPTPEIKDVQSYILAAEDLGNMDDFDFNDMVIKVSTPMENTESTGDDDKYKIEVTALAAGGTLPLKLCREGEVITSPVEGLDDEASEQFHSWFGTGKISSSTMINTYSVSTEGHTRTIYLSEKEKNAFSMSSYTTDVAKSMGGFSFKVQRSEEEGYTTEVKAPENGKAPQMICVPDTWKWPTERTNISKAYPDFGTWGGNYTNTEWIKNYEDEKVLP